MSDTRSLLKRAGLNLLFFVGVPGLLVAAIPPAQAQTYSVLYNFCSQPNCADGALPTGPLVQDKNGNLYGTTIEGGTGTACIAYAGGCGTVFELTPTGTYTVLYSFTGSPDGESPSDLVLDQEGNLYGTTGSGGVYNSGIVFEITSSGTEKVLYSFTGGVDGAWPQGPLVLDAESKLYGTTGGGGQYDCYPGYGCGTVFELSRDGTETTLYAFTGGADDGNPSGGVIRDAEGNLYGTTAKWVGQPSPGTVFKLTPSGVETQLYSFLGGRDGSDPNGGVARDANGNLFGTTYYGGLETCQDGHENGCGVVFEVTAAGKEKVRRRFTGKKDGGYPTSLVQDAQGNLYGTTNFGGDHSCLYGDGCGVIFEIPRKGKATVLFTFTGGADWDGPSGTLLLDTQGNLYGAAGGGAYGEGLVFELTP